MNDALPKTLVPDPIRLELSKRATLGAGNFLAAALETSAHPDEPLLFNEVPFESFSGERFPTLSLRDLDRLADQYAAWYWAQGVRAYDPVAVYRDDGVDYLVHYLALVRIGAIGVLTNGNMPAEIAALHFERTGCVGAFVDRARLAAVRGHLTPQARAQLKFLVQDEDVAGTPVARLPREARFAHEADDPIMIAHSSGTTGVPKAVLLQHERFFYGIRQRLSVPAVPGAERILSSLPHSHNCAIAYIMLALLSGAPVVVTSDHSGLNLARQIERHRPTMIVSFPQTYVELTEQELDEFDLSSVALWFNGGDAAHEVHIRRLVALGSRVPMGSADGRRVPGSVFVDGMGSSEMGFSLFRHIHHSGTDHYNRCVGKPHDWVDAQIVGPDGQLLPPGVIGRLAVKAPSVTTGYWNNASLTFKSRVQGYWLTGDLAYRDERGFFYHVDRTPDLIETPDGPVYSLEAEEILMTENPAVSDVSVVAGASLGRGREAVAFVRARPGQQVDPDFTLGTVNAALARAGRNRLTRVELVSARDIPLGTTGKVLKRLVREKCDAARARPTPSALPQERNAYAAV